MSFLTILSLVSLSVPGLAKIIQGALINFICMDQLFTDKWLIPFIFPDDDLPSATQSEEDTALNPFFDENGFSTRTLIKNLGSTFVYLGLLLLILCVLIPLTYSLQKVSRLFVKPYKILHQWFIWNGVFSFILQQYPPITIACGINLYGMKFTKGQSVGKMLSKIVAIILLAGTFVSFLVMYRVIRKGRTLRQGTQEHEEHNKKYEALQEGLKESTNWVTNYWKLLVIGRWTATNYILIVLKNFPQF